MSIKINFTAKLKRHEDLLKAVKKLAKENQYVLTVWENCLTVTLCPMGDFNISWEKEESSKNHWAISGECYSTPAGPGLHNCAVELLDQLTGLFTDLEVDDITDYYNDRDFDRIKREHFYPWLNSLINVCRQRFHSEEYKNICFCWDMNQYQPEEIPGTVITPLGRFSIETLVKCAENQNISWFANQFFLWNQKEKDSLYYRNTALNLLWERCCFVSSERSSQDQQCNEQIIKAIELCNSLDASIAVPISEYEEICQLAGHTPALSPATPLMETEFPIGFRKGLVTYAYGNLRLTLPGNYCYEWEEYDDEEGCDSWWDSASDSPVWRINHYQREDGNAEITEHIYREKDLEHLDMRCGKACWGWQKEEEDGNSFYMVTCEAVCGSSLFVITISYNREEERPGIYELLRKLEAVNPAES